MLRLLLLSVVLPSMAAAQGSRQVYVDASATGSNTGTSWADAYTSLASATSASTAHDVIRVAQGRYTPSASDRTASFAIDGFVTVLGGFAPGGSSQADPTRYPTILSGDLLGDDGPGFANRDDNSLHVVRMDAAPDAALSGVTVSGGNAYLPGNVDIYGGGFFVGPAWFVQTLPARITNVIVTDNSAAYGGGMYVYGLRGTAVALTDVSFIGNRAAVDPRYDPTSTGLGGALFLSGSASTLSRVVLERNTATTGGALYATGASSNGQPTIADVTFTGNVATGDGGAAYLLFSSSSIQPSPRLERVTFRQNSGANGGAVALGTSGIGSGGPPATFRDVHLRGQRRDGRGRRHLDFRRQRRRARRPRRVQLHGQQRSVGGRPRARNARQIPDARARRGRALRGQHGQLRRRRPLRNG